MILDSPLKIRDNIQPHSKELMPETNGKKATKTALHNIDTINPIKPIQRKIFPAKVNDSEIPLSLVTRDSSLSSSKRFSDPESSFIFLIFIANTLFLSMHSCQKF